MASVGASKALIFGEPNFATLNIEATVRERFTIEVAKFDEGKFDQNSFDNNTPLGTFTTLAQSATLKGSSFTTLIETGTIVTRGESSFSTLAISGDLIEGAFAALAQSGKFQASSFATLSIAGTIGARSSFTTLDVIGHIKGSPEIAILPVEAMFVPHFDSGVSDAALFYAGLSRFHPSRYRRSIFRK